MHFSFGLKMGIAVTAIIIITIINKINTCAGYDVFFPLSSVRLTIPTNEKALSIFTKIPFGKFQVVSLANNSPADSATNYTYSLEKSDEGDECLQINKCTGEVLLTETFQNTKHNSRYIVSAMTTQTKPSFKMPHMSVEIVPTNSTDFCGQLENLCYWSGAHYTVKEDRPDVSFRPVRIGSLRPNGFNYLCSEIDVSYKLMASEFLTVKEGILYTKKPIDHESLNVSTNGVFADVKCIAEKSPNGEPMELIKRINVTVLDRNDNGPKIQNSKDLHFQLEDPHFQMDDPIGEKIYFLDADTLETNSHITYEVHNDKFNLIRPSCNAYESDHNEKRSSIISCQLVFARNGLLNVTPYCFALEASDLTIDSINLHAARTNICIYTDLSKIHEMNRPTAEALRSSRQHRKSSTIVNSEESLVGLEFGREALSILPITFAKDVYVYRKAMEWNRVIQPANMVDLINMTKLKFRIEEDRSGAFGITERAGILFVRNTTALLSAVETVYFVTVNWTDTYNRTFIINIHLRDGHPTNTSCEHKEKSRTQTCAQIKSEKQCTKFCGLATDGGPCHWRGVNNGFSRNYASCVPNSMYCPDNICDPLESLNIFACPQDCAASNKIMGPHTTNDNRRGILSASGTCICEDNGKCSCAPLDDDDIDRPRKGRKKNQSKESAKFSSMNASTIEPSTVMNSPELVCGTSCLILAITCPTVLILIITCLFFSRRKYVQKAKGKSLSPRDIRKGDCDARNGDLPLMLMENSFKFDSDTKWEIARDQLILDTTLGEGEFGKVFKGYATDIPKHPGVTTVAVKMLKNGANSVEYMALLSEFQLLQEVSHPNVIKLLGACTKGDAPMIIIEYAKYGSLRGYLRLSRKIECAGVDFTDGVEPVTVRDILSFAWQICKGMAYLTEIKLVHRDLAARNILLAERKVCKISDFGLTRDVYEDDAYLKRSRDRVPVKWMAPESLADHVYTTKSDVWAFGVLCWELITLGASPYPGIPPQNLYHLLKTGYRMERPENCSEEIYSIMRSCWTDDPNARPSFKYIASEFEKLLGNNAKYIEIESNAVSNPLYCGEDTENKPNDEFKLTNDLGEPDCLDHLWHSPKISYDTNDNCNSKESGVSINPEFLPPPGYDMPRPLIEANITEQILRYENDLRFPLNVRKSIRGSTPIIDASHYAVPVKRGRSYIDMTNKTLIPDNLNNNDVEKNISKNISFRFSSLLNLNEQDNIV
ncbi:uncharacterized protein LOC129920890 [Episyrphus balteatus]|uniref:uncharacterized protein LOC129920890 n=1 Tax=Episyrphus balteatus TaxID=286459 RepID=UPI002486698C|nr:uncharacterized protein LOC129920890 [Episyrphus balteatus]